MPLILLTTEIDAPAERCFDLSLSVDIHVESTKSTGEKAIAGVTSGPMKFGDTVTWRAKHFGITQDLTSHISYYDRPKKFVSEMIKGAFRRLYHEHIFEEKNGKTIMTDRFDFDVSLGLPGRLVAEAIVKPYMAKFLRERNLVIKRIAESEEWREYLPRT